MSQGRPSLVRAWCYLVWLSLRRQARARQMVLIALGLLAFAAAFVALASALHFWDLHTWRKRVGDRRVTYGELIDYTQLLLLAYPRPPIGAGVEHAVLSSCQAILDQSPFLVFSEAFVFSLFLGFLLPVWTLSFATEAIGGERESNNLIWLLSRPLPRPAIYLGKFLAVLPWSLGLGLGGFWLLCLLAGWRGPGQLAWGLYWPAVAWATVAFAALFYLVGACFRRPAVIAIVYVFFLEIILNLMPGYLKRISIGFYARCMMYEAAEAYGLGPDNPSLFLAVDASTARLVLASATLLLLGVGTFLFSRMQYQDGV
jgi:ABC-type transport system involved in multi-copper enzyme maturation permease subunit